MFRTRESVAVEPGHRGGGEDERAAEPDGTGARKYVGLGLLLGAMLALASQWPEIRRYLKMRTM